MEKVGRGARSAPGVVQNEIVLFKKIFEEQKGRWYEEDTDFV